MTPLWLKGLNKVIDLSFVLSAVHPFLSKDQHEKLIVAFIFPFLLFRPWQLRSTPKMLSMGRELSQVFQAPQMACRSLLRNFLLEVRSFPTMPSRMVWKVLYFGGQAPFPISLSTDGEEGHGGKQQKQGEIGEVKSVEVKSLSANRLPTSKRRRLADDTV